MCVQKDGECKLSYQDAHRKMCVSFKYNSRSSSSHSRLYVCKLLWCDEWAPNEDYAVENESNLEAKPSSKQQVFRLERIGCAQKILRARRSHSSGACSQSGRSRGNFPCEDIGETNSAGHTSVSICRRGSASRDVSSGTLPDIPVRRGRSGDGVVMLCAQVSLRVVLSVTHGTRSRSVREGFF